MFDRILVSLMRAGINKTGSYSFPHLVSDRQGTELAPNYIIVPRDRPATRLHFTL